ncbi:tRNA glutamyl-Q(34) synthetase GluQRS [Fontivita pretiosa]|uniref:tRNA glutamyl-Q(34) synthetase GluQRS n=1 Tax=Fontivita pretiosa TaxID=2989684 RepID=UPI003D165905
MHNGITRLAPSPTGALHLGNARTFLVNWMLARRNGWRIVLRIEDLDGPRVKRGADLQAIQDLHWLGIDWDDGPIYQSQRQAIYQAAVQQLLDRGLAYPCVCSRREAALAASAPHAEDGSSVYPGTCRDRFDSVHAARAASGRDPAIRFRVPHEPIEFNDAFRGPVRFDDVALQLGDFVIAKADGTAAYQLAVVIDDAQAAVNQVVRGDDLIDSTPRQILLYRALQMEAAIPRYTHLPLVVGPDGRRLAKRHGDTRLSHYRELGVSPHRVLALLGRWCGIEPDRHEATVGQLLERFSLDRLPRHPIVMTPQDEAWLRE